MINRLTDWLRGATVALLTPDQKVACSNHVGVKLFFFVSFRFRRFWNPLRRPVANLLAFCVDLGDHCLSFEVPLTAVLVQAKQSTVFRVSTVARWLWSGVNAQSSKAVPIIPLLKIPNFFMLSSPDLFQRSGHVLSISSSFLSIRQGVALWAALSWLVSWFSSFSWLYVKDNKKKKSLQVHSFSIFRSRVTTLYSWACALVSQVAEAQIRFRLNAAWWLHCKTSNGIS